MTNFVLGPRAQYESRRAATGGADRSIHKQVKKLQHATTLHEIEEQTRRMHERRRLKEQHDLAGEHNWCVRWCGVVGVDG